MAKELKELDVIMQVTVFGQIVDVKTSIKINCDMDLIKDFKEDWNEGGHVFDCLQDEFWDNVFIKGETLKFVNKAEELKANKLACNLYFKKD